MTPVTGATAAHRIERYRAPGRPSASDHAWSVLARTLTAAEDPTVPALHRLRLLAEFATDLDDLVAGHPAGHRRPRWPDQSALPSPSGEPSVRARALAARHTACFTDQVHPALAADGIGIVGWPDLDDAERTWLRGYFQRQLLPLLVPAAVDAAHPFPRIVDRSLNLAVIVADRGTMRFAQVAVPGRGHRFVSLAGGGRRGIRVIAVEDVIAAHLGQLFRGVPVIEHHQFRITRGQPATPDGQGRGRAPTHPAGRGDPVRLEVSAPITDWVLSLLLRHLHLDDRRAWRLPGPLDLAALTQVHDLAAAAGVAVGYHRPAEPGAGASASFLRKGDRHPVVRAAAHPIASPTVQATFQ